MKRVARIHFCIKFTSDAEEDALHLTPHEARLKRDTQDSPTSIFPEALVPREGPRRRLGDYVLH
jgi:hypothetical protein